MPIEAGVFNRRVISRIVAAFPGIKSQDGEKADADYHVQGVYASHGEVEREKNLDALRIDLCVWLGFEVKGIAWDVVLLKFAGPFNALDSQENQAQKDGRHQQNN